jgi:hypothetical protein
VTGPSDTALTFRPEDGTDRSVMHDSPTSAGCSCWACSLQHLQLAQQLMAVLFLLLHVACTGLGMAATGESFSISTLYSSYIFVTCLQRPQVLAVQNCHRERGPLLLSAACTQLLLTKQLLFAAATPTACKCRCIWEASKGLAGPAGPCC